MKKEDCPFCSKEIVETSFMSSDNFRVIYNQSPILPGHCLVIPKEHVESMFELTPALLTEFINLSVDAAKIVLKIFKAESFDWTVQEKEPAGQTISHLHLHIIPRHEKDLPNPGDWYPLLKETEKHNSYIDSSNRQKFSRKEIIAIVEHIKKEI